MSDYIELRERLDKRYSQDDTFDEVIIKQPRKTREEAKSLVQQEIEPVEHRRRRRTLSDGHDRRLKERRERERRRLKQLEEDEIRRRGRRKKQRMQRAKNAGQKAIYDAQSKEEFESEMDKVLANGDLDDISEMITAHNLTKCKTNSLEKALEVSYKLKNLADSNYPDADDFRSLAKKVEDFSIELLEPLKGDDMKRAIFEGQDFDRIAEKSVLFRQKKFISHPVVFNLLMKRWRGVFDTKSLAWPFLQLWAIFDFMFFPLVFVVLYMIKLIVELTKKECHAVVIMSPCNMDSMDDMQDLTSACFAILRPPHTTHILDKDKIELHSNNIGQQSSESSLMGCLKSARKKFTQLERAIRKPTDKLLIVMTDDKVDASLRTLTKEAARIKNDRVRVVSVGFGVHPDIKELEAMATTQQNVFLYHGNIKLGAIVQNMLESLRGKSLLDQYLQYFNTPIFIFERDTLSYLALLGLHFAMCLQPSKLEFSVFEWIIMLFFLGRLFMEIYQAVMEKLLSNKIGKRSRDFLDFWFKGKEEFTDEIDGGSNETNIANQNRKKTFCRMCLNIMSRYFSDWWNALDLVTLIVYIVILIIRSITWAEGSPVSDNRLLAIAGYFYGLNTMFLTLRVFGHIMETNKNTGSIQIALFQIFGAVITIFGEFLAAILAFSLAITKVYVAEMSYNKGKNSTMHGFCEVGQEEIACWWGSARHLFWSLLGEPDVNPLQSTDEPSDFLAHLLYGLFLLLAVVMLMNMMIALLSNTYQAVEDNAFYEWSYRRATTIRTYVNYHPVPVPFNIISFILIIVSRLYKYIVCSQCCVSDDDKYSRKRQQTSDTASFFDCLVFDLQAEYFSKHGYAFPLAESNKMDWVFRETEGNRQLIGHIANQVFTNDKHKPALQAPEDFTDNTKKANNTSWNARGIDIKGHQLTYVSCDCAQCSRFSVEGETRYHGAVYYQPFSRNWPGFEVLIQESVERRLIVIGVVPGNWPSPHVSAGIHENSAAYHVDEGKIFDTNNQKIGIEGAMAHRGDLIGCKLLYDGLSRDGTIPVLFTLNGRVIGEGRIKGGQDFYPFVGIGWEGISLLFKMTSASQQTQEVYKQDKSTQLLTKIYEKVESFQTFYEDRETAMQAIIDKLEQKVDILNERCKFFENNAIAESVATAEGIQDNSSFDIKL